MKRHSEQFVAIWYYGAGHPVFVAPPQAAAAVAQGLASECWVWPCPSLRYLRFVIAVRLGSIWRAVTGHRRK